MSSKCVLCEERVVLEFELCFECLEDNCMPDNDWDDPWATSDERPIGADYVSTKEPRCDICGTVGVDTGFCECNDFPF